MTHPFSEKSDEIVKWQGNSTTVHGKKYVPLQGRNHFDSGNLNDTTAEILKQELSIPDRQIKDVKEHPNQRP